MAGGKRLEEIQAVVDSHRGKKTVDETKEKEDHAADAPAPATSGSNHHHHHKDKKPDPLGLPEILFGDNGLELEHEASGTVFRVSRQ